jgi:hypothetical protein
MDDYHFEQHHKIGGEKKKAVVGIHIFGKENYLVWANCGVSERRTFG